MKRQPVITGLGIVSPIGIGVEAFWAAALAGRSGLGRPTLFDASRLPRECSIVGEVKDFDPLDWMPPRAARMAGRFSQFAVAAARMAWDDSFLASTGLPADRLQVSIGTSMNGLVDLHQPNFEVFLRGESVLPWTSIEYPAHAATSHVAQTLGAFGQTMSIATACAAGIDAVIWAIEQVRRGEASAVIAGGTDATLSPYSLTTFYAAGVLSRWEGPPYEASRPFDRLRSGLVAAEGAAVVIIEDEADARSRGAHVYARVLGFAGASEGGDLRKIDRTGQTDARAVTLALESAGLSPRDIDYVSAHGNSMIDYDAAETAGVKAAFGRHAWSVPISSLKSMCGQALGASGAIQVVAACLSLRDNAIPPTINYHYTDPICDLDYVPNAARAARVRTVLIHSHSMGGSHSTLILGSPG